MKAAVASSLIVMGALLLCFPMAVALSHEANVAAVLAAQDGTKPDLPLNQKFDHYDEYHAFEANFWYVGIAMICAGAVLPLLFASHGAPHPKDRTNLKAE